MSKKELEKIRSHVQHSFQNVRQDTTNLYDWVRYMHERIEENEQLVVQQQTTIQDLNKKLQNTLTKESAQELVAGHSALKQVVLLQQRIQQLHQKMSIVATLHDAHDSKISELHSRLETVQSSLQSVADKKTSVLQDRMLKNIARNSKLYIKNAILTSASKHDKISALQLKELVVDEQQICSKSSFYRLLSELEKDERVVVINDGKQKVYSVREVQSEH